jgi:hypothetical protein
MAPVSLGVQPESKHDYVFLLQPHKAGLAPTILKVKVNVQWKLLHLSGS